MKSAADGMRETFVPVMTEPIVDFHVHLFPDGFLILKHKGSQS
jgi:hypothetical protein